MAKSVQDKKFEDKLQKYALDYDVESLNESNDRTSLHMLIRTELMADALHERIQEIMESEDLLERAADMKRLSDLLVDTTETVLKIQRQLGIDRKTRKTEETDSVASYIRQLKVEAKNFIEQRMVKIYCPTCKVMVGRFAPVHDHTGFVLNIECSQCGKSVQASRKERDIWFDIKDSKWRREHPVQIVQPTSRERGFITESISLDVPDELIIEGG